ncbi:hypothetical protein BHECKSOX2_1444 [Bathymodiolus heckerae thiotrophic gill symbiont]|nr:hypothetical protein BHECKSOX2_1444 [Bathymodiolus heckerae thiotrophic gill symbiont]
MEIEKNAIIRFWAPWCGSCRVNEDIINSVYNKIQKEFSFFKINIDREVKLAQFLNVQHLPEMIVFDANKKQHRLIGEITSQKILKLCQ